MDSLVGDTGLPSVTIQVKHGNSEQQQQRHSTAAFSTAVETTKPPHEAHRGMTRSELRIEREHRYFVEALTQAGWNDDEELVRTNKCIGLLEAILHPDNERRHNGGSMVYDMRRAKVSEREEDNYMDSPPLSAPLVANDWQRMQRMPIVIPSGSYRLGAQLPSSVLDILVLAPERYSRETYFIFVSHILQKQPKSIIQQVHPIPDADVPVIKFIICGISVDMFIAKGNAAKMKEFVNKRQAERSSVESGLHTLPQRVYLIDDDDYLADDQDEFGIRSLNGVRVAQEILTLVPHLRTFQIVLVSVKKFAMANGIYSNVLGFLGGISYAIMVAYICIDSNSKTSESPVDMLEAFFETFAAWDWSKPVILGELQSIPSSSDIPTLASWNATLNESDRRHLMPIITPAYPSMNSAYNVGTFQKLKMMRAFHTAVNHKTILNTRRNINRYFGVHGGTRQHNNLGRNLFSGFKLHSPRSLSHPFTLAVEVLVSSQTHPEHVKCWRYVESRLRLLIATVHQPTFGIKVLHMSRRTWSEALAIEMNGIYDYLLSGSTSEGTVALEEAFYIAFRNNNDVHLPAIWDNILYSVFCQDIMNAFIGRMKGPKITLFFFAGSNCICYAQLAPEYRMQSLEYVWP